MFATIDVRCTRLRDNGGKVVPMRLRRAICCFVILIAAAQAQSYVPKDGFVPDSATAVKIAEAVLIPAYGRDEVEGGGAYEVTFENGIWTVGWTLDCPEAKATTCVGGTAEVKLREADGRILKVIHYDTVH